MPHLDTPPRYRLYLLAIWEEQNCDLQVPVQWRFSLEDPQTGQRRGFASLEALVAALRQELAIEESNDKREE